MLKRLVEATEILESAKKSAKAGKSKDCLSHVDSFVDWCVQFNPSGLQEIWWSFVKELTEVTKEARTIYKVLSYVDLEVVCKKNEVLEEVNNIAKLLGVGSAKLLKEATVYFYIQKKDWNRRELFSLQVINSIDIQWFRSLVIGDVETAMNVAPVFLGNVELINERVEWLAQSILRLDIPEYDTRNILSLIYTRSSQPVKEDLELRYLQSNKNLKNLSDARYALNQEILTV